ncbi:HEAT repeat domain-containing protein [Isosphaeraceae bacterium EP7]
MDRKRRLRIGLALAALGLPSPAVAQVIDRETSVTGPRGRTIERHVRSERQGGVVQREVDIKRPAGTYRSQATIARGQRPGPPPPPQWGYPGGHGRFRPGPPPPIFVERPRPSGYFGIGMGAPLFNLVVGSPAPPPPIFVYPEPVVVAPPPPVVVYNPPIRYAAPQPETIVIDPVEEQIQRLSSNHDNSREDACNVLGRLGDPRALPPLVDRLKDDEDRDVRIAAAWALANIGDPGGLIVLERASAYDKNSQVRGEAVGAYRRLEASVAASSAVASEARSEGNQGRPVSQSQPASNRPAAQPYDNGPPPPPDPEPYLTQPRR